MMMTASTLLLSPWLGIIAALIVIGVLFWAANRILAVLPVAEPFKTIIYVVMVVAACFIVLSLFGILPSGFGVR